MRNFKNYRKNDFFHYNPLPSWIYDIDSLEILDVNLSAINHYGYSRSEFVKMTIKDLRPKEDVRKMLKLHDEIKNKKGNIYLGKFTHYKKDGHKIQMEINGHQIVFQDRECLMAIAQDVSEREAKLKELKEFKERLKTAADIAKLGYWRLEPDGNTLSWSDEVYKIWGREKNGFKLNYQAFFETIPPDERNQFKKEQISAFNGNKELNFTHRICLPDGSYKWVHERGRLTKHKKNGKPIAFEGTVQDITKQKLEEQQLKLFNNVATHSMDGIIILDHGFKTGEHPEVVYANPAFSKITGYSLEEFKAKGLKVLFRRKKNRESIAELNRAFQNRKPFSPTIALCKKNGDEFWSECSLRPVADQNGIHTHWSFIIRDVSKQKRLIRLLDDATEMARIGSWEVDLKNRQIYWSPMIRKLHEVDKAFQPNFEEAFVFYRKDFREKIESKITNALNTGNEFNMEAVIVTAKNRERWVQVIGKPEMHRGESVRLYGSMQDIHEKKSLEQRLTSLADNLPGVVFQYYLYSDGKDEMKYISKGAKEIWGYTPDECREDISLVWKQTEAGGSMEEVRKSVQESAEKLKPWNIKWRSLSPDGEVRWLEGFGKPNKQPDGTIVWNSIVLDHTEKTHLNELLKQAGRLTKIGSWEIDIQNGRIVWSKQCCEIHEVPADYQPTMERGINFYKEPFRKMVIEQIDLALKKETSFDFEAPIITAKGDSKWLRIVGSSQFNNDKCIRVSGAVQDISMQKQASFEVEKTLLEKNKILDRISDAFFAVDLSGKVTYWNKKAEEVFGYKRHVILNKELWSIFKEEDNKKFRKIFAKALKTKNNQVFEKKFPAQNSWLEVTAYPSEDGLSVYLRDITYRKKHEEELMRLNESLKTHARELELSNQELEQFAFIASHDLQEPLRMISSFLNQLERKYGSELDEKAKQYIYYATDGAKRMKQIIMDLLNFSRAGNLPAEKEQIDLNQLIEDYKLLRNKLINEKTVQINLQERPIIEGYKVPLTQVFHCLLDNAIKYSKEDLNPKIDICLRKKEKNHIIAVKDNGIGIEKEYFEKIFVIFQRLHNREQYDGTGIGLSIAKKHVESWGGEIWLESEAGEGSCFYFTV